MASKAVVAMSFIGHNWKWKCSVPHLKKKIYKVQLKVKYTAFSLKNIVTNNIK